MFQVDAGLMGALMSTAADMGKPLSLVFLKNAISILKFVLVVGGLASWWW